MTDRITQALKRRRRHESALSAATTELHDAIRAEVASGLSVIEAAKAAGMSRQAVYQIIRDERQGG